MESESEHLVGNGRSKSLGALAARDKRLFVRARMVGLLGWPLAILGRFLVIPNKHGLGLVLGWSFIGLGVVAVFGALLLCFRLERRGRRLLRKTQDGNSNRLVDSGSGNASPIGELRSNGDEFWNGTSWVSAKSADGKMKWDGERWVPAAP
jgi:hypothetical protein